jgi:hypothetical protein
MTVSTMAEPHFDQSQNGVSSTDLALKRYDAVFRYLAYENNAYWTRAQFFLLANTALAAFLLNQLPMGTPVPTWNKLGILVAMSAVGVALTWLWRTALESSEQWIRHWHEVLVNDLEADAFADILVLRHWDFRTPPPAPRPSPSAKKLAHWLAVLFSIVWSLSLAYLGFLAWAKFSGWRPAFIN